MLLSNAWGGIAKLREKILHRRANELIAIAHPDFRAELRKEAQKIYWPWDSIVHSSVF